MIKAKDKKHLKYLIDEEVFGKNNLKLDEIDVSNIVDFSALFIDRVFYRNYGSIENWNVSKGKIFNKMFFGCKNLWFDFSKWNMQNAISCSRMFENCYDFEGKGLEHWNLKNVIDCSYMFSDCSNFDIDVSNWDMSNVINLESMFFGCRKFRGIGLDKWKINIKSLKKEYKVGDRIYEAYFKIDYLFYGCTKLDFDISNWKIEIDEYVVFNNIFNECHNFKGKGLDKITLKIKSANIVRRGLEYLFVNCYNLQVLPKLDAKEKIINADYFRKCYSLTSVGDNRDFEIDELKDLKNSSNIKLKEFPYKFKYESSFPSFSESNFPNISPIITDRYIYTNRRHKIKTNDGKYVKGFANVKILKGDFFENNLRLCTFVDKSDYYESSSSLKSKILYRIKKTEIPSNCPNSIIKDGYFDKKIFSMNKNIFFNKSFQNKYFCNK